MAKIISVYGPGCKKCKQLKENVEAALNSVDTSVRLEYITDAEKIAEAGVMSTPALAVGGHIVSSGKVLKIREVAKYL